MGGGRKKVGAENPKLLRLARGPLDTWLVHGVTDRWGVRYGKGIRGGGSGRWAGGLGPARVVGKSGLIGRV